ncbi:hypothetical protein GCM10009801_73100 [Streptomyces albiaxialis]|uniref:Uncharacterized protein n=1 Tax=Streptomyces albiaxialis TaxID=329523 RepID=A0ABN2WX73_9ACTN
MTRKPVTKRLAAALDRDDQREENGMHPDDRATCHTHQSWAEDCADRHMPLTAGSLLAQARELDRVRYQAAQDHEDPSRSPHGTTTPLEG